MQRLFPQKLLTIITVDTLEDTLAEMVQWIHSRPLWKRLVAWRQWLHDC